MMQKDLREVGTKVWFFYTECGLNSWRDAALIYPEELGLISGVIVYINSHDDEIHVYREGDVEIIKVGFLFFNESFFETREKALDSMAKRLMELAQEKKEKLMRLTKECQHKYTVLSGFNCVECGESSLKDAAI